MTSHWTVAYASVMGNLHVQQGLPCQDSCSYHAFNENWGLAIVCDGAGSSSHAHLGSEKTARLAEKYFVDLVETQCWQNSDELPSEDLWQATALLTLRKVRDTVAAFAEQEGLPLHALAATIIVVLHQKNGLLVAHIGDGRAAYFNGEAWQSLIVPLHGALANETVFLTSDIWDEREVGQFLRTHRIKESVEAFALLTDGCEKSSFEVNIFDPLKNKFFDLNRPFPKFFNPNMEGLKKLRAEGKSQAEINQLWADFLTNGTAQFRSETDDKTMILGVWTPATESPSIEAEGKETVEG